jgi:hypothetical protein
MASVNWNSFVEKAEAAGESIGEYSPVPEGTYETKVLECKAKKASTGKDMLVLTHVIEGGEFAGRRLFQNMVWSPDSHKSVAIFVRQLRSLGQGELLDQQASFEQIAAGLVNQLATVNVVVGEYNNKPKNDIKGISGRKFDPASKPQTVKAPPGLPI